jgi:hypothetical protein
MRTIVTAVFLFFAISVHAQNFEGKIVYSNTFQSKTAGLTKEQLTAQMGKRQDYYIKNGSYRSVMHGSDIEWALYISSENRLYSKFVDKDVLEWADAGSNSSKVKSIKITKSVTVILGYQCDEAILETDTGVEKYYYSSEIRVDPSLYVRHKLGNWYELIKTTRSLPLKSVIEYPQFTYISTATGITPMKLNEKDFELPKGMKSEKSTY